MDGAISLLIVAILFAPMFYKIHKRLDILEKEITILKSKMSKDEKKSKGS